MSFLFRRQSSSDQAPPPADFEQLRSQQLLSLSKSGARAINKEQNLFDLPVYLPCDRILFLRISLSDRFPIEAPSIMTTAKASHPWLNNQMQVIGHVDLNSWSRKSELGKIVTEIALEFTKRPPTLDSSISAFPGQQTQPHHLLAQKRNPPQVALAPNQQTSVQNPTPVLQSSRIPPTQSPPIPNSFPELELMPSAELEVLVADQPTMDSHVQKNQSVVQFLKCYDELVKWNSDLAKSNLKHQAEIEAHYETIATLSQDLKESNTQYKIKQEQKQALAVHTQASEFLDRVRDEVHVLDEESETIASAFTNGEMDMGNFVNQYLTSRTAYHLNHDKLNRYSSQ